MTYRPSPELIAANAALVEALRRRSEAPPASHGASTAVTAQIKRRGARASGCACPDAEGERKPAVPPREHRSHGSIDHDPEDEV